jgi:PAS domain-containing protein
VPKVPQALRNMLIVEACERVGAHAPSRPRGTVPGGSAAAGADRAVLSYEWLFDAAAEAVLVVEESSGTIVEANLAAARLLHTKRGAVIGKSLLSLFHTSSAATLKESLAQARGGAAACARAIATPDRRNELSLTLSVFHLEAADSYMLVRLAAGDAAAPADAAPESAVFEAIEGAVTGFLVTDSELRVQYANPAFARMIEVASPEDTEGESIALWLELTPEDRHRLRAQMARNEAVTELITRLRSVRGAGREVEVRAVAVPSDTAPCWGFTVREIRARAVLN